MGDRRDCYVETAGRLHQMSGQEIAETLRGLQGDPSEAEYRAWRHSIPILVDVIHRAGLDELTLVLEYRTPIGNRIDAVLLGEGRTTGKPLVLIIELKQWSSIEENTEGWESRVFVRIGRLVEDRPHPVQQTLTYAKHLRENHSGIAGRQMEVRCCQFLHNFENKEELFLGNYQNYGALRHETYGKNDGDKLAADLRQLFSPIREPTLSMRF